MSRWRDEDDVRIRPSRRNSTRRSKDQPTHATSMRGFVVSVDRGRITCALDSDHAQLVTAVKARSLGRKGIVVGDFVDIVGDVSGSEGSLARIVRGDERTTTLRRTADDTVTEERIIVANAEQLAIVAAIANPTPRPRLIDRYLVAAFAADMKPILVLTKSDLGSADELLAYYTPFDIPIFVCGPDEVPEDLRSLLATHRTVLVGHSGVGKSTLLNTLVPTALRRTGDVNVITGRGRHTSTNAEALPYGTSGWLIDTPGIRSFGLAHVSADDVLAAFPIFEDATDECPRGCTHDEPECGLDPFVAAGHAGPSGEQLVDSIRRLLRSLRGESGADS